jgi:hypothetical protein
MKFTNILVFILLITSACETDNANTNNQTPNVETDSTNHQTPAVETKKTNEKSNWLCIPNKQVGLIKADADEESIIEAYGKENVIRQDVGIGEGEMVAATIVFPGTPNELIVEWMDGFEYKKLSRIRIEQKNAQWRTEEGIKIGTTFGELLKINGKDFNFYGFDWDYGGITNEWEGGNINSQLTVFLDTKKPEGVSSELSGDGIFSSSNPLAKEAQLEVVAFIIYFGL